MMAGINRVDAKRKKENMRIEKISYEQLFCTGQFTNQRLRVEISLEEHDFNGSMATPVVNSAFELAKELVNNAFQKINPDWEKQMGTVVKQVDEPIDKRVAAIIADINSCEVIDDKNSFGVQYGLIAYQDAANSNPVIKAAYDLKMKQLKGGNG